MTFTQRIMKRQLREILKRHEAAVQEVEEGERKLIRLIRMNTALSRKSRERHDRAEEARRKAYTLLLRYMGDEVMRADVDAAAEGYTKAMWSARAGDILRNAAHRALRLAELNLEGARTRRKKAARHLSAVGRLLASIETECRLTSSRANNKR